MHYFTSSTLLRQVQYILKALNCFVFHHSTISQSSVPVHLCPLCVPVPICLSVCPHWPGWWRPLIHLRTVVQTRPFIRCVTLGEEKPIDNSLIRCESICSLLELTLNTADTKAPYQRAAVRNMGQTMGRHVCREPKAPYNGKWKRIFNTVIINALFTATCTMVDNWIGSARPCGDVTICPHEMLSSAVHKLTAVSSQEAHYDCG